MQRKLTLAHVSEDEEIKAAGLTLDFDEIAKRGAMTREEGMISKWYGIYGSRQKGNHMARMVIPGGEITSSQARTIATTAENYCQGRINITTRQSLQYHWIKVKNIPLMLRDLAQERITTFHGCGDVNRNTAACPMAENCAYRRFNVRPIAKEAARSIAESRELDNLPRKFKITFSGCGAGCAQPYINCLGYIAVQRDVNGEIQDGFKVVVGGGMGWKGFVAQELFSFVPKESAVALSRAVALLFRDHGDRYNRAKARLKYVVATKGVDFCRKIVLANLTKEGHGTEGFLSGAIEETGVAYPDRPLTDAHVRTDDGKSLVRIMVPMGEMTHTQLRTVADLGEMYGNQRIITTNRQNLELHGIEIHNIPEVKQRVQKIGLSTDNIFGITDIVPCVGVTYCPKAVSTTRNLYDLLMEVVRREKYLPIKDGVVLNITGCPNSCSPYRIADIGFRGMRIREELGSVEGYEMLIGGDQKAFGRKLGDFKFEDCREVLEIVLDTFMSIRSGAETLTDCVTRVGIDPFREAVYHEVSV
ncbi:MAG: hypothetical protein GF398_20960 [Chitinivibrionales bacterium]|nr:hypothetical protein [Chitinivibrionales bacterium]